MNYCGCVANAAISHLKHHSNAREVESLPNSLLGVQSVFHYQLGVRGVLVRLMDPKGQYDETNPCAPRKVASTM